MKKLLSISLIFSLLCSPAFAGGFNGSGTYVRYYNWTNDKANSIPITASRFDTEDNGFATGLSNTITKDGQQTTTALIPFAVGIGVAPGTVMAPTISVIGDQTTGFYQTTGGELRFASSGVYAATINANGLDNTPVGQGTAAGGSFTTLAASSTLGVTGATTLSSTLAITGNVSVNTNKFTVAASSGNTLVAGTLTVTGAASLGNGSTATTQSANDNSTKLATTAYVDRAATVGTLHKSLLTSGTTWTSPSGITSSTVFKVTVVGGGGGSAGANPNGIAAGGAGGTAIYFASGLSASTGYTYAIGAAGSSSGGNGGNTSITFGATTVTANGGAGTTTSGAGGAGGTASNGDINIAGQSGQYGNGSTNFPNYPNGGSSLLGGGGSYASAPTGYGAGAGGGSGNAGTQGAIFIEWVQ